MILVEQKMEEGLSVTEFRGRAPFVGDANVQAIEEAGTIAQALIELQLGEGALRAIAEQNRGKLITSKERDILCFVLRLPVASEV